MDDYKLTDEEELTLRKRVKIEGLYDTLTSNLINGCLCIISNSKELVDSPIYSGQNSQFEIEELHLVPKNMGVDFFGTISNGEEKKSIIGGLWMPSNRKILMEMQVVRLNQDLNYSERKYSLEEELTKYDGYTERITTYSDGTKYRGFYCPINPISAYACAKRIVSMIEEQQFLP